MTMSLRRFAARRSSRAEMVFKREMVRARIAAGLSQAQVAERLGVNRSTIWRLERLDSDPRSSDVREYLATCEAAVESRVVTTGELRRERAEHEAAEARSRQWRFRYLLGDDDDEIGRPSTQVRMR